MKKSTRAAVFSVLFWSLASFASSEGMPKKIRLLERPQGPAVIMHLEPMDLDLLKPEDPLKCDSGETNDFRWTGSPLKFFIGKQVYALAHGAQVGLTLSRCEPKPTADLVEDVEFDFVQIKGFPRMPGSFAFQMGAKNQAELNFEDLWDIIPGVVIERWTDAGAREYWNSHPGSRR